MISVYICPCTT